MEPIKPDVVHLLTTAQAIAFVKKVDRTNSGKFCLRVRLDARIEGNASHCFPDALATYMDISRAQALRLVSQMLSERLEERGARITITESYPYFPGSDPRPTYWIG